MAKPAGALVICGTPIGNLQDASPRLARALAEADVVACEDTREARKLLANLGVRARLVSYHEGNERQRAAQLAERVAAGERVALVSDAGMPVISDPGFLVVRACVERGLPVEVVPGPSAVLTALVVSGLPAHRFCFEGFLPSRPAARDRRLAELAAEPRTMVLFEAPHRLLATLDAMAAAFGAERRAAVCRELTKLHEEVLRGTLAELRALLAEREEIRGEVVVVVEGAPPAPPALDERDLAARVAALVKQGRHSKEAIAEVAREAGVPRRAVYQVWVSARRDGAGPAGPPGAPPR